MRRNELSRPGQPIRNLFTNPSFETASGTVNVRTNLLLNPSFEAVSGTVNVRTNLATNPSVEVDSTNWSFWMGGSGAGTVSTPTTGGYVGTSFRRVTYTTAQTGNATGGHYVDTPITAGKTYSASVRVRSSVSIQMLATIEWAPPARDSIISTASGVPVTLTANVWTDLKALNSLAPTGAGWLRLTMYPAAAQTPWAVGDTIDADALLVEEGPDVGPYFDGASPISNLVTNPSAETNITGWVGKGGTLPTISRNTTFFLYGNASVKIEQTTATSYQGAGFDVSGLIVGKQYTMSAYVFVPTGSIDVVSTVANIGYGTATAGVRNKWVRLSMTFTATATTHNLGFDTNGNAQVGKVYYIDGLMLNIGNTALPYMEGQGDFSYLWAGTAHASTSNQQAPKLTRWITDTGSKVWQSTQNALTGTKSARVFCNGAASGQGFYHDPAEVTGYAAGDIYTASATVTGPSGATAEIVLASLSGPLSTSTFTFTGSPQRVSATLTLGASGTSGPYIVIRTRSTAQRIEFSVDSAMIEKTGVVQPYFDGATPITNPVINPDLATSTADWVSGQPLTRVFEDGKWWMNAPANTHTYAGMVTVPGQYYAASLRVKGPAGTIVTIVSTDNVVGGYIANTGVTIPASGEIVVRSASGSEAPRGTLGYIGVASNTVPLKISEPYAEKVSEPGILPYYGYFKGQGDFTYAWSGTANASSSLQQAVSAVGVSSVPYLSQAFQSTLQGVTGGTKSIRITPTNSSNGDSFAELNGMLTGYTFKPNTTYTISGNRTILAPQTNIGGTTHFRANIGGTEMWFTLVAPVANVAGTQRVVGRFTTGASTALAFIRLYNGSWLGGGDVWWDDVMLVEGTYDGPYVDGSKPFSKWEGTANASTSVGYPY